MRLISIDISNWKCFTHKYIQFNEELNLLRWHNGEGKTSLIEAIIFAITDKRPAGLDFDSLRNDLSKPCRIELKFTHELSDYVIEREFGQSSSYRLYKDGELVSRTRADNRQLMEKIIPDVVINGLWGYNSLALSPVLKTDYLFELLDNEFSEPLALKKYFQQDRTFNQKNISSLEKTIRNQNVTQADVDNLTSTITNTKAQLKEQSFVPDSQVVKARQCEADWPTYCELQDAISKLTMHYDRETCLKLWNANIRSKDSWDRYFESIRAELATEKAKAKNVHPLAVYPRQTISSMITESEHNHRCVLCGNSKFMRPTISYEVVDQRRIGQLESMLQLEQLDFMKYAESVRYWQTLKKLEAVEYVNSIDWKTILDNYNEETNNLYDKLAQDEEQLSQLTSDLGKLSDLLTYKAQYNDDKECMNIIDEYIDEAKAYYADNITKIASTIVNKLNARYSNIFIENGVYKVVVQNSDYSSQSTLAVQSLSMGEKTIVSLSLILAIRNLFTPDIPLIMDEAFSNLDADNVEAINQLLLEEHSQWILVSHDDRMNLANAI